jgi:cytochrome c oxidase subunit 2
MPTKNHKAPFAAMHNKCRILSLLFSLCWLSLMGSVCDALPLMNMPKGVTPIANEIYNLHMITLGVCAVIGILVFGVLFYSLFKYRKSQGAVPALFHEHIGVEIAWTVLPFLILIGLAVPATMVLKDIDNTNDPTLNIRVTGYQWKWGYTYLDDGITFFSNLSTPRAQINGTEKRGKWFLYEVDRPLVVPIKEKVRLLVTSNDVIHSWWVPELGVKQDAIPGYVNENWFYITKPGTYRGQCAELCGQLHGFMPIVVKAVTRLQYDQWVAEQKQQIANKQKQVSRVLTKTELMTLGEKTYNTNCVACHQPGGVGLAPSFPALRGSAIATGPVSGTIKILLHGVQGSAMQAWGNTLDKQTLAAVITYVRSAWGNEAINQQAHHQTIVQASDVAKSMTKK